MPPRMKQVGAPVLAVFLLVAWSSNTQAMAALSIGPTSETHSAWNSSVPDGVPPAPGTAVSNEFVIGQTKRLVKKVRSASSPELEHIEIRVESFHSDEDFFRARFGIPQFFFGRKQQFLLKVNPEAFEWKAPEAGLEAIVAHELSHMVYYSHGNRLRLFG